MTARRDCWGAAPDKFFIVEYLRGGNGQWYYNRDTMHNDHRIAVGYRGGFMPDDEDWMVIVSIGVPARYLVEIPWQVNDV